MISIQDLEKAMGMSPVARQGDEIDIPKMLEKDLVAKLDDKHVMIAAWYYDCPWVSFNRILPIDFVGKLY